MALPTTRRQLLVSAGVLAAAAAFALSALGAARWRGRGLDYVFRDLSALCNEESVGALAGLVSNAGILLWTSSAACALLAAAVLARTGGPGRRDAAMLLAFGALSALAALDDLLRLHDAVLPALGLPQKLYLLGYAAVVLLALWVFRAECREIVPVPLVLALLLLGASVLVDGVADTIGAKAAAESAAEDSLKWLGITMWTTFIAWGAALRLMRAISPAPRP